MKTFRIFAALTLAGCTLAGPLRAADNASVIGFGGAMPNFTDVQVESGNVYDYTFSTAPTDWWVQSGVWEMTNRWSCSPQWSWFGGRSEEIASIWNKRKFAGDFSVQVYFAFKMGMDGPNAKWHERPSDAAITVCGDGKNLGSGYSFIVGADSNEHSVLLRQGKVVAESTAPDAILTSFIDGRVGTNEIHRRWWFGKINRVGNRIECWLDNKLILTYDDPEPLSAGQMALWTYNNGLMLARVQVFYEKELHPEKSRTAALTAKVAALPAHLPAKR